jgi:hypothetical protein
MNPTKTIYIINKITNIKSTKFKKGIHHQVRSYKIYLSNYNKKWWKKHKIKSRIKELIKTGLKQKAKNKTWYLKTLFIDKSTILEINKIAYYTDKT